MAIALLNGGLVVVGDTIRIELGAGYAGARFKLWAADSRVLAVDSSAFGCCAAVANAKNMV